MTKMVVCDVCNKQDGIEEALYYFSLTIPHQNLDEEIDEPLIVDLCSLECLQTVVRSMEADNPPTSPPSPPEYETQQVRHDPPSYEGQVTVR